MNAPPIDLTKLLADCKVGQKVKTRGGLEVFLTCIDTKPTKFPYGFSRNLATTEPDFWNCSDGKSCVKCLAEYDIIDILPPFLLLP